MLSFYGRISLGAVPWGKLNSDPQRLLQASPYLTYKSIPIVRRGRRRQGEEGQPARQEGLGAGLGICHLQGYGLDESTCSAYNGEHVFKAIAFRKWAQNVEINM